MRSRGDNQLNSVAICSAVMKTSFVVTCAFVGLAQRCAADELLALTNNTHEMQKHSYHFDAEGQYLGDFAFGLVPDVTAVAVDRARNVLYLMSSGSSSSRIWRYESATGALGPITPNFREEPPPPPYAPGLPTGRDVLSDIEVSPTGDLFAITAYRLLRFSEPNVPAYFGSGEGWGPNRFVLPQFGVSNAQFDDHIVFSSLSGNLVATGTAHHPTEYVQLPSGGFPMREFDTTFSVGQPPRPAQLGGSTQIVEGPDRDIYIGNLSGLAKFDAVTGTAEQIVLGRPVGGIAFDQAGTLYAAHATGLGGAIDPWVIDRYNASTGELAGPAWPLPQSLGVDCRYLEAIPNGFLDMPPILMPDPAAATSSGTWTFPPIQIQTSGTTIKFDPPVVTGYDYAVAGTAFHSVTLPTDVGDGVYSLWLLEESGWVLSQNLSGGIEHLFPDGGVFQFRITGIETSAALSPTDTTAFITGLSFEHPGTANVTMTPITIVPEPASLLLFAVGSCVVLYRATRRGVGQAA
jgi:hypothetical protein